MRGERDLRLSLADPPEGCCDYEVIEDLGEMATLLFDAEWKSPEREFATLQMIPAADSLRKPLLLIPEVNILPL